jgi:hypothetical protein
MMRLEYVPGVQPSAMQQLAENTYYLHWLDALMELARHSDYVREDLSLLEPLQPPAHTPQMHFPDPETGAYHFTQEDKAYAEYMAYALRRAEHASGLAPFAEVEKGQIFWKMKSGISIAAETMAKAYGAFQEDYTKRWEANRERLTQIAQSEDSEARFFVGEVADSDVRMWIPYLHSAAGVRGLDEGRSAENYLRPIAEYVMAGGHDALGTYAQLSLLQPVSDIYEQLALASVQLNKYSQSPDATVAHYAELTKQETMRQLSGLGG